MAIELPEAVNLAKQMNHELSGKTIKHMHLTDDCASLIGQGFVNLDKKDLDSHKIVSVSSKGKWIFIKLEPPTYLLFALETGGKILYHKSGESLPDKFHVKLDFGDDTFLTVRILGWGFAKALTEDELEATKYPGKLGLSPIDDSEFTLESFSGILDEGGANIIKKVLLDQWKIAGIGNGYCQDILFRARVHPKRKANDLNARERKTLYSTIKDVLNEAVRLGGSDSERDLYDHQGGYRRLMGEGTKGKPCPKCRTPVEKISLLGSSCYICPSCQK